MRDSFVFYSSYYEAISELDEKTQLQIFKAVSEYALYGNILELSGIPKAIFALIKPTIDANEHRYNNGKKGGRPRKNNDSENQKPMVLNSETDGYENQKPNVNVNDNVNVNANANEEREENTDKPYSPTGSEPKVETVVGLYHEICKSYPKIKSISEARRKAVRARLRTFGLGEFRTVFIKAEESDFLKGKNDRNWFATFDWIIKESNFVKILEGNYKNNQPQKANSDGFDPEKYKVLINKF